MANVVGVREGVGCGVCGEHATVLLSTRHPGLGPGSTGPQGDGKRLKPHPSSRSGPRTKSGVTVWVGRPVATHSAPDQR